MEKYTFTVHSLQKPAVTQSMLIRGRRGGSFTTVRNQRTERLTCTRRRRSKRRILASERSVGSAEAVRTETAVRRGHMVREGGNPVHLQRKSHENVS